MDLPEKQNEIILLLKVNKGRIFGFVSMNILHGYRMNIYQTNRKRGTMTQSDESTG